MKSCLGHLMSFLLAFLMLLPPLASAEGGELFCEWESGIRLSITGESALRREAGMELAVWDDAVAAMKQLGLAEPVSKEAILAADENARILEEDGVVYFIGPCGLFGSVTNAQDAYRLAYRLVDMLGGSSLTLLVLKSRLTMNGETVYSFQQVCDGEETKGAVLKIAVDESGEVTAVFSSVSAEESREQTLVSREEAEVLISARCAEDGLSPEVLAEYTDRVFRSPMTVEKDLNLDEDADVIPSERVWVVYTHNGAEDVDMYPYLANYVRIDGEYLCSLPVRQPGDAEAVSGYRHQDLFAGMTAASYTGAYTDENGDTKSITVPVMYSEADGCWYLGDVDRRIVFADYFEAAYGENHEIVPLRSADNIDWDMEDVYFFYNYLRAYDFYAGMGWVGPDGQGTDVLILREPCYSNGMIYENACSLGMVEGWQMFAYAPYSRLGSATGFGLALDVLAHEYTHTFTATVMNQNLYENDFGAINEAMSDILGNLVEFICEDTEDTAWQLGENMGTVMRNMSDPAANHQPSSVWGLYYAPQTVTPNAINDMGGVHSNSSLLNMIAARLCLDYGMSYEEAISLWLMTAMGMTPRTDYRRIEALLTWALERCGLYGAYGNALSALVGQTNIAATGLPQTLPEGQKLVRLVLPDTEAFQNKEWALIAEQYVPKTPEEMADDISALVMDLLEDPDSRGAYSEKARHFSELLDSLDPQTENAVEDEITDDAPEAENEAPTNPACELLSGLLSQTEAMLYKDAVQLISWEDMDTGVIPVILENKPTNYALMNISAGGSQINKCLYLVDDRWIDLTDFMVNQDFGENGAEDAIAWWRSRFLNAFAGSEVSTASGARTFLIEYLPTAGLESVELPVEAAEEAA